MVGPPGDTENASYSLLFYYYYILSIKFWVYDFKKLYSPLLLENYLFRRFHSQKYDLIDILSRFEKEKKGNEKKIFLILFQNKVNTMIKDYHEVVVKLTCPRSTSYGLSVED